MKKGAVLVPRRKRPLIGLVLGGLGLAVVAWVVWSIWDRDAMMAWKRDAAPFPFFAAMTFLPAFGVPMTPFFVVAGATFGIGPGLLGASVALGSNLTLCYGIARSGLRSRLKSLLRRLNYELPDFEQKDAGAVRFTLFVKLTPGLPAVAKNYLLGLTGVPFPLYFGLSMVITGAYASLCVVLGTSLREHDIRRIVVAGIVVVVLTLALLAWRRRRSARRPAA